MPERVPDHLFLQPGEMVLLARPTRVKTVLGSCVAITMRVPGTGLSSIAHCLLPNAKRPFAQLPLAERCRYVDSAVARMLELFGRRGICSETLEIKLFGGSDHQQDPAGIHRFHVGSRNVAAALECLSSHGLTPVASGVGGRGGRLIEFNTSTGEVLVKRLPVPDLEGVA
jgi:chemotaxis protein CheD